jgi:hypothetical protein
MTVASDDTATFEIASGPRATVTIETLDAIEPQLLAFFRGTARWLDPWFPQRGRRGSAERGGWTEGEPRGEGDGEGDGEGEPRGDADGEGEPKGDGAVAVAVTMQQVEELLDGRGVRIIRLSRARRSPTSSGSHDGAIRLQAVGLPDNAQLELRWNFDASEHALRGTSAELTVDGLHHEECVADFRRWFGP